MPDTPRAWRLARLPLAEQLVVVDCAVSLAAAWLLVRIVPWPRIARRLARPVPSRTAAANGLSPERVTALIGAVSNQHLVPCACLEQALAAHWMLRRRGIASTFVLGVTSHARAVDAHAWVEWQGGSPWPVAAAAPHQPIWSSR
jgi:hypothetical protein